jgi:L-fucose mutarotase/ribose pyranase (RbsD/FucU family)
MQNGTRKAYFNFSLAAFDTTTTSKQAKYGPYTLKGGVVK